MYSLVCIGDWMRRSQLEVYIGVLKALSTNGPMKITRLSQLMNVNCSLLSQYLDFMKKQHLVETKNLSPKRVVYCVTEKGFTALRYFRELQSFTPMLKEPSVFVVRKENK